jgi:hypothetical protein
MLAQDIMKQGLGVIIDSTCNFQEVLDNGSACAAKHGYAYWYIECRVRDIDLLDRRLSSRVPMTSQRTGVHRPPPAAAAARGPGGDGDASALFKKWIENPCRPEDNAIIVDSTENAEMLRDNILKQIVGQ